MTNPTTRLRELFKSRDLLVSDLAVIDHEIAQKTRLLADANGVAFMRVEAARAMVGADEPAKGAVRHGEAGRG